MLGVVPDLLLQSSIVSASDKETMTAGSERLVGLAVADDAGPFGTLVFSEKTGLPVSLTFRYVTPIPTPQTLEMVMRYGDYRRVSGRLFPHSIDRESHGEVSLRLRIARYVVNGELPDELFTPATTQTIDRIVPPAPAKAPESR
jgi:hypothetical protein